MRCQWWGLFSVCRLGCCIGKLGWPLLWLWQPDLSTCHVQTHCKERQAHYYVTTGLLLSSRKWLDINSSWCQKNPKENETHETAAADAFQSIIKAAISRCCTIIIWPFGGTIHLACEKSFDRSLMEYYKWQQQQHEEESSWLLLATQATCFQPVSQIERVLSSTAKILCLKE